MSSPWLHYLDERPVIVAVVGPNGAGKSTFYEAHLQRAGLRFLNADVLARELELNPYDAAKMLGKLRQELLKERESFVFETVFSDPVGDKLGFLKKAAGDGYNVVLCFVGIGSPKTSEERVSMRVAQGGHDVPNEKLFTRFPRTLANLAVAIRELPCVLIFDNEDLSAPFRHIAIFEQGEQILLNRPSPKWLADIL